MSGLTYEQAKAAVVAGATLRVAYVRSGDELRTRAAYSRDGGVTWCTRSTYAPSDLGWMDIRDGFYSIHTPAPAKPTPRDYRAERDALRLRLDDALDELAACRLDCAEIVNAAAADRRAAEWQRRAEAAEAKLEDRGWEIREVAELAAHHALQSARRPPAPKWPAVGETAPWTTVWDHLQAEPKARYEGRYSDDGDPYTGLRFTTSVDRIGAPVSGVWSGPGVVFSSSRKETAAEADCWTYTRLHDAVST